MLVNLKNKINKIPQFPDKASTTKINLFLNNIFAKNAFSWRRNQKLIKKVK